MGKLEMASHLLESRLDSLSDPSPGQHHTLESASLTSQCWVKPAMVNPCPLPPQAKAPA